MKSYKVVGAGPHKVLLFPGLLGTSSSFDTMLDYSSKDRFQYVVPDYRGYGESRNEPGLFTLREAVIDAVRLVEYLGWTHFSVAGHSLGALVAQMVAVALPSRVSAIVMIAGLSARGAVSGPAREQFMKVAAETREGRAALVRAGVVSRYSEAATREISDRSFTSISEAAFKGYAMDSSRTDISSAVSSLNCPVLALVGQHDPNATEKAARETTMSFYGNATLVVLDGAGHYPMAEVPMNTVSAVENFLSGVNAAR
ncbi:MAG TPA: alpha/beta hydrolase [Vicinamibacterales bacterium]|nr:alpha/beta hydrolase [Vicinamibacterales bacterium]